jgi:hypothetical protein
MIRSLVAQAIGYTHGNPFQGVEGSKDGSAAVAKFINASMAFYDEPSRNKLTSASGIAHVAHERIEQARKHAGC